MDEDTRFRRALKNPLVMVGLCIVAGMAMYHNVIESTMNTTLPVSIASLASEETLTPTISTPSRSGHEEVATQWIENPTRDPFAPISISNWSKRTLASSTASAFRKDEPHATSPTGLTLKAIAIEAQHRSAVINRQVVREGEIIEGHQIVSIQLKGVWLKRHGRKQFLTFATNVASESRT